ncbi:MAG: hypothetical protein J07HX64_01130 [halophilic archaeon J07HX64]|nr:MAG: hypothetical protein J07HX64_01130 [halophilic archaeon J07HX64]
MASAARAREPLSQVSCASSMWPSATVSGLPQVVADDTDELLETFSLCL